jgi:hypothetical protein
VAKWFRHEVEAKRIIVIPVLRPGPHRLSANIEIFGAVHLGIPGQQLLERPAQLVESYYGSA